MKTNLESLSSEIQEYLISHGIAIFHGVARVFDNTPAIYWNIESHPDFRDFLATAQSAGVKLVTLYANEFDESLIDDALDQLDDPTLPRDERRGLEKRLKELRGFAGFTCQIELSFDLGPRVYVFDLRTDWFEELNDLLDTIEMVAGDGDDELGEEPSHGYFSQN
jgi:hypothetical protein